MAWNHRRSIVLALLLGSIAAGRCSGRSAAPPSLADRVEAYVQPFLDDGHLSGTLLVARDGQIVLERSYGMADHERGVPNAPETGFCIASVSKPMTIAVVARLAEERLLSPEDTLSKWLPDFPRGDRITIGHLLNHRAGIPHRVTEEHEETVHRTAADMVELVKKKGTFLFEPGEKSLYSSAGYAVLARVVELAAGKPFERVLAERLFEPAGMKHSAHAGERSVPPGRAPSYLARWPGRTLAPPKDLSFLVGAGSVYSTPRDLHAMVQALLAGKLGEAAKAALLREDGLHWNGITNGYRAFVEYDSKTGAEVIFAGNLWTGATELMRRDLPRLAAGEHVETPGRLDVRAVETAPEVLARYAGVYQLQPGATFPVAVVDGGLVAGDRLLIPTSETTFFCPQDYATVRVVLAEDGKVAHLDWSGPAGSIACPRLADARG